MSKRTFLLTAMISAFALTLLACGGVGKAEKDPFLASSVEKINAMFADMKGTNPVSQNMGMHLAFEERGLVLTINVMSDEISDEELQGAMISVETLKVSPENVLGVKGKDGQDYEVNALDVLEKLHKNDVDFIICAREKNGDVLAEAVLKASKYEEIKKKVQEREEARRKREEENKIFFADIEAGTFEDPRDHHIYRTGTIVGETWLADDLVYGAEVPPCDTSAHNSECDLTSSWYEPPEGKKYTWNEAQKACPDGWRMPSIRDFVGDRFRKFERGSRRYIDWSKTPKYWSSSLKKESGEEYIMTYQYISKEENGGVSYSSDTVAVPMSQANLPDNGKFVRCIKN